MIVRYLLISVLMFSKLLALPNRIDNLETQVINNLYQVTNLLDVLL